MQAVYAEAARLQAIADAKVQAVYAEAARLQAKADADNAAYLKSLFKK